jgi:hypothetical protein
MEGQEGYEKIILGKEVGRITGEWNLIRIILNFRFCYCNVS